MNKQQAQIILELAIQCELIDFDDFVTRIYPDRSDLDNIELTNMTLAEFIYLSRRVIGQFISQFGNRDNTLILPFVFTQPQSGTAQVNTQIQAFISNINSNQIQSAEANLVWLVAYQLENGFFYKTSRKSSE